MVRDSFLPSGRDETYGKLAEEVRSSVVSPLSKLTDEQKKLMEDLRKISETWNLDEEQKAFLDDMCLFRYLSGLQWNMEVASKQLKETMDWRASFRPQDIRLKDLEPIAKQGFLYHYGYDKVSIIVVVIVEIAFYLMDFNLMLMKNSLVVQLSTVSWVRTLLTILKKIRR